MIPNSQIDNGRRFHQDVMAVYKERFSFQKLPSNFSIRQKNHCSDGATELNGLAHSNFAYKQNNYRRPSNSCRPSGPEVRLENYSRTERMQGSCKVPSKKHAEAQREVALYQRLAVFKYQPLYRLKVQRRPVHGEVCSCLPYSRGVSESAGAWGELGHYNILHVTTSDPSQHWFTRYCCYLVHCSRLKVNFPYPAISNQVILEDDRIQTAVDQVVNESIPEDLPVEKRAASCRSLRTMQLARAHRILNDMKAAISTTLIRITGYVLFKVFSRLLKSVVVHKGQLEAIQRASKKGTPLIFVPLHRSHVDYLFVTWVLFNCQIPAPIVAAGENLNMPVFGALLRGTGGFFIKRRLESNKARRDVLYRALLQCYMSHSLHAGYNLEFFIEGGRTRTGKPAMPKGGLLSVILDAYLSGMLDDAMIVPIAINYDKLVDGNFIREQLGQSKVPESFWGAVCAICKVLSTNYGQSRIDFGAPFSLKEFVQLSRIPVAQLAASGTTLLSNFAGAASKGHHRSLSSPVAASHLTVQRPPSISSFAAPASSSDVPCTTDTQLLPAMSNSSLFGTELTDEFRELVKKLGQHIVFDAERCQAMMSSNLVAWVVSFQHRGGATLPLLSAAVHDLKTLLQQRGRDVGFTGDSVDVVKHAVRLLGPSLIRTEVRDGVTVYSPVTCLPNVIELNYYANALLPVFAIDAIIAVSLQSILDCELWPYCDTEPSITVELDKLMKRSLRLCEVFAHEFVLYAPCGNLSTRLLDAVDRLCVIGFLSENKSLSRSLSRRYHGASAHQDDFDSWQVTNEPCDVVGNENNMLYTVVYNVLPTTATLSCLTTFSNMLTPLLDAYCSTVETLQAIVGTKIPEKELVAKTQLLVRERLADESIKFGECIAADPIKNCIKMLESEQVLQSSQQDGDKLINLTTPYNSLEALVVLHDSLAAFRV
ncbi:glycerol-3-phosphate acyltransferase 1, mitochondrial isoform X2 [Hyalella azteca]|uniref:Glycerol-3-phosphate acyltransferase 1, mitochondrial isoform X2 n=1 Tax=Hyalella azteca TaxID=294128 RepID=A0A979FJN0_HYAAZ|nr:glycerol-3-phosphate acyltransferase 1, mitochondrial isoform X2 [Hyalella azteca]